MNEENKRPRNLTVHVEDTHPHQYLSHHLEDPCQTLSDIIIQIPLDQNHQVSFSHDQKQFGCHPVMSMHMFQAWISLWFQAGWLELSLSGSQGRLCSVFVYCGLVWVFIEHIGFAVVCLMKMGTTFKYLLSELGYWETCPWDFMVDGGGGGMGMGQLILVCLFLAMRLTQLM